jgi:Uma2 family endonuclease
MSTEVQSMTAEQLLAMPHHGRRYELVNGELRSMAPAGFDHGYVAMKFSWRLAEFVEKRRLGIVCAAETGFILRRHPDTVRALDAAFVRRDRCLSRDRKESFYVGAPDLAVEVVSPSDSFAEVEEKVFEWLSAGSACVLVLNPRLSNVSLYRSKDDIRVLSENDLLDLSFVVPDFTVAVKDLFE